mgnify:CR=1 FL=1|jgi:HNH endonuclease.
MQGSVLNDLLQLGASHSLYREDGRWYHHLKMFPGVLFDKNGYIIFNSESEYLNHSGLQRKKDLHIKNGIQSLSGYQYFTASEIVLLELFLDKPNPVIARDEVIRKARSVEVLLRDQSLVSKVKMLYNDTCQICGLRLKLRKGMYYSEVHHIKPLGKPFNGPDCIENMICVCPNHHILLDFKAIPIAVETMKIVLHEIGSEYINFHNSLAI